MKFNHKLLKIGELFCGPGGFAEGAKKAGGYKHIWANDLHPETCETFKEHHPDCLVVAGDVYKEFIKKKNEESRQHRRIVIWLSL
jgi:site-specific DNA-cytosine methylase